MSTAEGAGRSLGGRIRATRPPKPKIDPWTALGVEVERERLPAEQGTPRVVPALTLFLAGAECPFTCVFCDLWRYTLDGPTPPGALPRQVETALEEVRDDPLLGGRGFAGTTLKLYNASNFFDPRAVPPEDLPALSRLAAPFERVVVESHPRLLGDPCRRFADSLDGRLEVALGVETVHPQAQPRLNKKAGLDDLARAAEELAAAGIGRRAFVLVGAPFVPASEAVEWAVRSVEWAFEASFEICALIPVRGGNGEMERLAARGEFTPPTLSRLEAALDASVALPAAEAGGVVTADLWDLERFSTCSLCLEARRRRLEALNLDGEARPPVRCQGCGTAEEA